MNKKEALAALAAGKKIRQSQWAPGVYVFVPEGGSIVLRIVTPSGRETCSHFDWNAICDDWSIVLDERDELEKALYASSRLKAHIPSGDNLRRAYFNSINEYLNLRARELGLKVSE